MTAELALIDVDGVAADFTDYLLTRVGSDKRLEHVKDWDVFKLLTPAQLEEAHRLLGTMPFWEEMPVIEGAKAGVQHLRALDFEIRWVTAPWWSCVGWEHARRTWLKTHFDAKPKHVSSVPIKDFLRGTLFIDDKPEHVASMKDGVKASVLFHAPYNETFDWPDTHRMRGWADLGRVLKEAGL